MPGVCDNECRKRLHTHFYSDSLCHTEGFQMNIHSNHLMTGQSRSERPPSPITTDIQKHLVVRQFLWKSRNRLTSQLHASVQVTACRHQHFIQLLVNFFLRYDWALPLEPRVVCHQIGITSVRCNNISRQQTGNTVNYRVLNGSVACLKPIILLY